MHHRRLFKAHKTNHIFKSIQINQSGKQIPMCVSCDQRVPNDLYDGPGIY